LGGGTAYSTVRNSTASAKEIAMAKIIEKLASEFNIFEYKELPQQIKRQCRNNIIAIITGRNTKMGILTDGLRWLQMDMANGNTLWLEFGITSGALRYCESITGRGVLVKSIFLEKLSKRAELLLAITYRPVFEIYKQYLENRNAP